MAGIESEAGGSRICDICADADGSPSAIVLQASTASLKSVTHHSLVVRGSVCPRCEAGLIRAWNLSRLTWLAVTLLCWGLPLALLFLSADAPSPADPVETFRRQQEGTALGALGALVLLCAWLFGSLYVAYKVAGWAYQRQVRFVPEPVQRSLAKLATNAGVNRWGHERLHFQLRVHASDVRNLPPTLAYSTVGQLDNRDGSLVVVGGPMTLKGEGSGVLGTGYDGTTFGCITALVFVPAVFLLGFAGVPKGPHIAVLAAIVAVAAAMSIGRLTKSR